MTRPSRPNRTPPIPRDQKLGRELANNITFDCRIERVMELMRLGACLKQQSDRGLTALSAAIMRGRDDITAVLIGYQVDIERRNDEGMTALVEAASYGQAAIVRQLLDAGANIDACDNEGDTAYHIALSLNDGAVISMLEQEPDRRNNTWEKELRRKGLILKQDTTIDQIPRLKLPKRKM